MVIEMINAHDNLKSKIDDSEDWRMFLLDHSGCFKDIIQVKGKKISSLLGII